MTTTLTQQFAIVTTNLTKQYGTVTAADQVSLEVPVGSIFGFLGPNGAGKTTTIRMLLGFIRPSHGSGKIFGHDIESDGVNARKDLGYLVPGDSWYPHIRGGAQLEFAARLSGKPPVLRDRLLDALEFATTDLDKRLNTYSKGMRQKLALVAAAQHDPLLLILDEPTDGLDPLIQHRFEGFLSEFRDRGRTVFMSSHDLAEVERSCDRLAVIRHGQIVAQETVTSLKKLHRQRLQVVFHREIPAVLATMGAVESMDTEERRLSMIIDRDINELLALLANFEIEELTITPPSLDDIFLEFYQDHFADRTTTAEVET
jgi:beta-exotoxin I transport system ATP-binding protein